MLNYKWELKSEVLDLINIIYSSNDKYFNQIFLSVLSMIKHTNEVLNIHILTLDSTGKKNKKYYKVTDKQVELLNKIVKEKNKDSKVTLNDMKEYYESAMAKSKNKKTAFTPYCLLRLLTPKLKWDYDKILYIDTDTMFLDDVALLYNIDISDYELGGVQDAVGHYFFGKKYINTGVLLINYKKLLETNESNTFDKCINFLNKYFTFMPDQDAINKTIKYRLILPRRFNEQKKIQSDTVIKHFCNQPKFFPIIHIYKYKQTQIDDVHKKLKIFEFDDIYEIYLKYVDEYPIELNKVVNND